VRLETPILLTGSCKRLLIDPILRRSIQFHYRIPECPTVRKIAVQRQLTDILHLSIEEAGGVGSDLGWMCGICKRRGDMQEVLSRTKDSDLSQGTEFYELRLDDCELRLSDEDFGPKRAFRVTRALAKWDHVAKAIACDVPETWVLETLQEAQALYQGNGSL
jgi:hypothetical protein